MTENVNIPLLRKAVEWAEAEAAKPEDQCAWDQMNWVRTPQQWAAFIARQGTPEYEAAAVKRATECGTAYCIAGYVAAGVGGDLFIDGYNADDMHVSEVAALALGIDPPAELTNPQSEHLFHGWHTIADVRRIAESLAGERL